MNKILPCIVVLFLACLNHTCAQTCLVADYPFSGNANDVSGNGNNGTVNNATLTTDRFGIPNSAYQFDGVSSHIDLNNDFDLPNRTITGWFMSTDITTDEGHIYISDHPGLSNGFSQTKTRFCSNTKVYASAAQLQLQQGVYVFTIEENRWYQFTQIAGPDSVRHYIGCTLIGTNAMGNAHSVQGHSSALLGTSRLFDRYFKGKIDDIKIYDCALDIADLNIGCLEDTCFVTVVDTVTFNDTLTTTLYDTTFVVDTISVTVTDTVTIAVTDTLIINLSTGLESPLNEVEILVYPNPTNERIYIDLGNVPLLPGHTVEIVNALGQQVFLSELNLPMLSVALNQLGGPGAYNLIIRNPIGTIISQQQIILQ